METGLGSCEGELLADEWWISKKARKTSTARFGSAENDAIEYRAVRPEITDSSLGTEVPGTQ